MWPMGLLFLSLLNRFYHHNLFYENVLCGYICYQYNFNVLHVYLKPDLVFYYKIYIFLKILAY